MRTAAFLRNVRVLAGLPDDLLEHLAGQVVNVHVRAGEWIMRDGDSADSVFIVVSGRLEVIDEGPPETLIRILRRGDVLGELALLRSDTRSASVMARRDSELLELGRAAFEALIQEAPSFALGLTRSMGAQLAASRAPIVAATPPQTIAVVGLDAAAPAAVLADMLSDALASHGSVASLAAGELSTIDQALRDRDRVVLREVQVVVDPARRREAVEATARRLAGRSLGIVFSGGGARALAHLGALEELTAAGLRFDRVAGVSFGSFVGAATAAGFTIESIYESFERGVVATNPSNDFAIPAYSLIRGAKTRRLLYETFGELRIEELPLRFFCLSCDLIAREAVLHRTGRVVDALYPSAAIPGVFPPVATRDGRLLVDGGVLDNLPVATMARRGEGPLIAVDVSGRVGQFRRRERPRIARLGRPIRRALTGSDAEIPRLGETIMCTVTVGSIDTLAAAHLHADLVIAPQIEGIGLLDWKALWRVVELGRRAAREALAAEPDLASRLAI